VLAAVATWVYAKLVSSGGAYTSFCNLGQAVNCDSVLKSPYGKVAGLPVSAWAIGFYLLLGFVGWRSGRSPAAAAVRPRADALLLAMVGFGVSAGFAVLSLAVLRSFCLLCGGLYLVSLACLFAAWRLASPFSAVRPLWAERLQVLRRHPAASTALFAAAVLLLLLPSWLMAPTLMSREEAFRTDPQFYDWYTSQPVVDVAPDGRHAKGPENARLRLVEFSDFECPHCRRAHVTLKDLLSRYAGEVRFVFRHFPLSNECNDAVEGPGHRYACAAAVASECAGEQGQFEAYANLVFARQEDLGPAAFRKIAEEVGLDLPRFERCIGSPEAAARVRADIEDGKRAGVRSTPTFFLNGRKVEGNLTFERWLLAFAIELDRG
jgi:protein-disulfide isomerase/uncharacterized membrane protein